MNVHVAKAVCQLNNLFGTEFIICGHKKLEQKLTTTAKNIGINTPHLKNNQDITTLFPDITLPEHH